MNLEQYKSQIYSCLRCGFCFDHEEGSQQKICPPYNTYGLESYGARGKVLIARAVLDGVIEYGPDVADCIYACTECDACVEQCFKYLDLTAIYRAMKQDLADRDLLPSELTAVNDALEAEGNPYRRPRDKRLSWAPGTERVGKSADVLLFVGCTPAYLRRGIAQGAYRILDAAGVDFGLLADEECCGHPYLAFGLLDQARAVARRNVERIVSAGAETVLFSCPGCLRTFREEIPHLLGEPLPFEVLHVSEACEQMPELARLRWGKSSRVATYHDPCNLGRGLGIYEPPRELIRSVPSARLTEMPRTRDRSYCCGNGGFTRVPHESMAIENETDRFAEAVQTGADLLITSCPACDTAFLDARRRAQADIEVLDLVEWLAQLV